MMDPEPLHFRRLRLSDLPLMHAWLNTDFVIQWYGRRWRSYEEVVEKYAPRIEGQVPTHPFLIMYGDVPIGYIQTYMIRDYPDYSIYVQVEEDAAGVDLFIGDERYIHKRLGSFILTRFLREVVFGTIDAGCCVIGPEPNNSVAIRAYQKAGFVYLKTVQLPDEEEPEYLMHIERADKKHHK